MNIIQKYETSIGLGVYLFRYLMIIIIIISYVYKGEKTNSLVDCAVFVHFFSFMLSYYTKRYMYVSTSVILVI